MSFYSTFNTLSFVFRDILVNGTSKDTLNFDGSILFFLTFCSNVFKVLEHFFGYVHGLIYAIKKFFRNDPRT